MRGSAGGDHDPRLLTALATARTMDDVLINSRSSTSPFAQTVTAPPPTSICQPAARRQLAVIAGAGRDHVGGPAHRFGHHPELLASEHHQAGQPRRWHPRWCPAGHRPPVQESPQACASWSSRRARACHSHSGTGGRAATQPPWTRCRAGPRSVVSGVVGRHQGARPDGQRGFGRVGPSGGRVEKALATTASGRLKASYQFLIDHGASLANTSVPTMSCTRRQLARPAGGQRSERGDGVLTGCGEARLAQVRRHLVGIRDVVGDKRLRLRAWLNDCTRAAGWADGHKTPSTSRSISEDSHVSVLSFLF